MVIHEFKKVELPKFRENANKSYGYYELGTDNKYYDYLMTLYKGSSNHSSMIDTQIQRIVGTGFQSDDPIEQEKIEKYKLNEWFNEVSRNLVMYGGFSTEIIWNELHTNILEFYNINLDKIRIGMVDDEYDEPTLFYYSPNFSKYTYSNRNKNISLLYTFNDDPMTDNHQLLYNFGTNRLGDDKYPRPDYSPGIPWVETDVQIPIYYMNLIHNNFMVSNILVVPYLPNSEDRESFEKGIKEKFVGADNAASTMVVYSPGGDSQEVKVINLAGDQGERKYDELLIMTAESIARAHRIPSPILAGLTLPGNLFGISDLPTIEKMYNKSVIYPKRQQILNDFQKINNYLKTPLIDFNIGDLNSFDEKTT